MNYCIDANVFITVWHTTYPRKLFPSLYQEMESKLPSKIILIKPIFDEIEPLLEGDRKLNIFDRIEGSDDGKKKKKLLENHPVRIWLKKDMRIRETLITDEVERLALELMEKYEIDNNSAKGASSEDIKLIAFASLGNHTVVTLESQQNTAPRKKSNYKIPLICAEQKVKYIGFTSLLERCSIRV